MKIGYARVSTGEQCLDLQLSALKAAGCDTILSDHEMSGSKFDRPGLLDALRMAQAGDTLLVWRLDCLGRSLSHLVEVVGGLGKRGIEFVSLTESIDTRSSTGMLMFHMIAALAEFERGLISERTRAGLAAARARGTKLGRPKAVSERPKTRLTPDVGIVRPASGPIFQHPENELCLHGFHRCDARSCSDISVERNYAFTVGADCEFSEAIRHAREPAQMRFIARRAPSIINHNVA